LPPAFRDTGNRTSLAGLRPSTFLGAGLSVVEGRVFAVTRDFDLFPCEAAKSRVQSVSLAAVSAHFVRFKETTAASCFLEARNNLDAADRRRSSAELEAACCQDGRTRDAEGHRS
jgi:hypothetical protein